jgi:predicted nucleotidyltransferase
MRLTKDAVRSIRYIVGHICEGAEIWLFGSRVDDCKKGGDIDLYIETEDEIQITDQLRLKSRLQRALGFRKIDLIIRTPNSAERSIFQTAKKTGVRL